MSYAFITGASSGIGEACARRLAQEKWNLVLVARRLDRLTRLAGELSKQHGVDVRVFPLDVTDRQGLSRLAHDESALFGKVTLLVNNAGLAIGRETLQDSRPEDWDVMFDTNVKGLLNVTHFLLPHLLRNRGHVVNIGSVAGRWAYPKGAVYCASKAAVRMLNEGMRLDLHGTGVRVTTVDAGMVESEFSQVRFAGNAELVKKVYEGMTPLAPADVADAVFWAVSRPPHVNIQEIVLYCTDQASVTMVRRD